VGTEIHCFLHSYRQCFDLEGEYGIVVRGIGTAVTLTWLPSSAPPTPTHLLSSTGELGSAGHVGETGYENNMTFCYATLLRGTVNT
jgi:hypothetical protein